LSGREKGGAGAGLVDQEHFVVAGDRHRDRGEHRSGIRDQDVDLVLGNELIVERGRGRGVALIVIGDELERNFLVEGFDVGAAFRVLLIDPELEPVYGPAAKCWRSGRRRHKASRA
jgi:hypothetical protein